MSTVATVLTFARAQGQTDSNGLTDANGIIFINEALLDFRRKLITNGVDAAQVQESYRDVTAGIGTYLWPTDMAWLKTLEVNFTDGQAGNFILAQQVDAANLPGQSSFSWLRGGADTSTPYFDDRGDWFEIFPTPPSTNTGGIRIIYFLKPTEYAATTDTLSYPESLDYRILGFRAIANYYRSLTQFDEALAFDNEYEKKVKDWITTLARGSQQPLQATSLQIDGWQF